MDNTEIHKEDSISDALQNSLHRDKSYVKLLDYYVENQQQINKSQLLFKWIFFVVVIIVFFGTVLFGVLAIWNISQKACVTWKDIGIAITGLGSILSVIIVLPSKIAEHLFPAAGDKLGLKFVRSMQKYDLSKIIPKEYKMSDYDDIYLLPDEDEVNNEERIEEENS